MPRWQLREMGQQTFLEKLLRVADEEAGDEYYEFYRLVASAILKVLPAALESKWKKLKPGRYVKADWLGVGMLDIKVKPERFLIMTAMEAIRQFSRTPEEAVYLVWRFGEKCFERAGTPFTRGYNSQRVVEQEKIYGGPATDDAPEEEVQAALRD
ncbi:MAG: hypothetical protein HYW15_00635 [Candidatus Giovannonibacteria bacterium]|nr:MAG: hypothetical protein HYW15_00635 [Candidatus Giovannonibacteria bacterium]